MPTTSPSCGLTHLEGGPACVFDVAKGGESTPVAVFCPLVSLGCGSHPQGVVRLGFCICMPAALLRSSRAPCDWARRGQLPVWLPRESSATTFGEGLVLRHLRLTGTSGAPQEPASACGSLRCQHTFLIPAFPESVLGHGPSRCVVSGSPGGWTLSLGATPETAPVLLPGDRRREGEGAG